MPHYVVHYKEIGIKGDNRVLFERQLMDNIRASLAAPDLRMQREYGRILLESAALDPSRAE